MYCGVENDEGCMEIVAEGTGGVRNSVWLCG